MPRVKGPEWDADPDFILWLLGLLGFITNDIAAVEMLASDLLITSENCPNGTLSQYAKACFAALRGVRLYDVSKIKIVLLGLGGGYRASPPTSPPWSPPPRSAPTQLDSAAVMYAAALNSFLYLLS